MSYLRYIYLFACSVVLWFCFDGLRLVYLMLQVFSGLPIFDCPFGIL